MAKVTIVWLKILTFGGRLYFKEDIYIGNGGKTLDVELNIINEEILRVNNFILKRKLSLKDFEQYKEYLNSIVKEYNYDKEYAYMKYLRNLSSIEIVEYYLNNTFVKSVQLTFNKKLNQYFININSIPISFSKIIKVNIAQFEYNNEFKAYFNVFAYNLFELNRKCYPGLSNPYKKDIKFLQDYIVSNYLYKENVSINQTVKCGNEALQILLKSNLKKSIKKSVIRYMSLAVLQNPKLNTLLDMLFYKLSYDYNNMDESTYETSHIVTRHVKWCKFYNDGKCGKCKTACHTSVNCINYESIYTDKL